MSQSQSVEMIRENDRITTLFVETDRKTLHLLFLDCVGLHGKIPGSFFRSRNVRLSAVLTYLNFWNIVNSNGASV